MNRRAPASTRRGAVRVAPPDVDETGAMLCLLLELPYRLPLELWVRRRTFALLGAEAAKASAQHRRRLALDFLAPCFGALGFDAASELASGLFAEFSFAAECVAFGRLGPRGLAVFGGRCYPSARVELGSGREWPPRSTASRRRSP